MLVCRGFGEGGKEGGGEGKKGGGEGDMSVVFV